MDCQNKTPSFRLSQTYAAVLFALATQLVQANPMGGSVVSGQASFNTSGNTLTVSNTPGTILNWQNFSIQSNETTRFAQQSAASSVLNRVVTNNPSQILGSLQSNGRVFLVNPSGIVFGAGATVDVAGLVATTLNLSDADFQTGRHNYTPVAGAQNISNAGSIKAQQNGQIYLIAPNVDNSGVITAPNGEILLAAGSSVQLVNSLDPNLRVNITAPAGNATNVGQLVANAGSLGLFGTIVKNTGTVSADSATLQGGKIVFKASQLAQVGGTVSATGTTGGSIEVLGKDVQVTAGGALNASGTNGGGTVLVGGDAHGANPNVQNAQTTYVDATATIKADATQNGNGGKVVVWADKATEFGGSISARGGAVSGNGGWVEVSGKQWLGYAGLTDTRASNGATGSLLLDPTDITISNIGSTSTMIWNPTGGLIFSDGAATPSNLSITTLVSQLVLTNVTVDTTSTLNGVGNITVQTPIAWNSASSLTLNATGVGAILTTVGSTITNAGTGGLTMQTAGGSITLNAAVTLANGTFTGNAGGANAITINAPVNTGTGAINLTAGAAITETGGITTTGSLTASGAMTLNGTNSLGSLASRTSTSITAGTTTVSGTFTSPVVTVNGGTLNLNDPVVGGTPITTLNVFSGVLGGTGAISVAGGTFNWTGGTLAGTGTFATDPNANGGSTTTTMSGTLTLARPFANSSVINQGTAAMTLNIGTGGSFTNNGTFNLGGVAAGTVNVSDTGVFKNGATTCMISPTNCIMNSTGSVTNIIRATLGSTSVGTITNSGMVYVVPGNTLNWTGGQATSNSGSWFIGDTSIPTGVLNLSGATGSGVQYYSGAFTNVGTVNVTSGTNIITGNFVNFNALRFATGNNTYDGNRSVNGYSESPLTGSAPSITFSSGTNSFSSPQFSTLASLTVNGGVNTLGNGFIVSSFTQNGGTLNTSGTTMLMSPGNITLGTGSSINAGSTGLIALVANLGAGNFINNSGSAIPITAANTQIFSADPATNVKGGMVPSASLFNCSYATAACGTRTIPTTGTVFLYSQTSAPTLSIIANALSKVYGAADPVLTYTVSGLVGDDTVANVLSGSLIRDPGDNANTYLIKLGGVTAAAGYGYIFSNSNYTPANFTISPALLTVTADALNKVLGASDPLLTYTVSGLQMSDTAASSLSGALARNPGEGIGIYKVNQGNLLANSNYTMSYVPCDFTILASTLSPKVVQGITQVSLPLGMPTDTEKDKKHVAQATAKLEAIADSGSAAAAQLPVCR